MNEHDALAGKVALITGASRGIGFAIARRLGQMGARVSICGRDQAKLEQAASSLRGEGIETLAVPDGRHARGPNFRPGSEDAAGIGPDRHSGEQRRHRRLWPIP